MLRSVELENYRGFARYRLSGLARVNLLVGKNNCGKTSVLEAIQLLASRGDPDVLARTARQRGEVASAEEGWEGHQMGGPGPGPSPVVSHFFYGHRFEAGSCFRVRSAGGPGTLTIRVGDSSEGPPQQGPLLGVGGEFAFGATLQLCIELGDADPNPCRLPVTGEGAIVSPLFFPHRPAAINGPSDSSPVQFVAPDSLEPGSMTEMWNKVISEGRESEVIEAMQILEPDLTNIFFLSGDSAIRYGGRAGVLVGFKDPHRRDPLGSHGDGMRRLLALSLSLIRAGFGVLLVDEIDTGLHYSVMGQMWHLVTEAAKRANVQVFATTHSDDCVRGLAWLCRNFPDLKDELSLQKIDPNLEEAVALDAEEIVLALDQGMEVR